MPWSIKQDGNRYCVYDKNGKSLKCYDSEDEAEKYRGALSANSKEQFEALEAITLETVGNTVISGVAVTNIPHLPLPEMSVIEKDGEKFIRVPFLRKGIFSHPVYGRMVFNDALFDNLIESYQSKKVHHGISLNLRHDAKLGALSWFTKREGFIQKEQDPEFGDILVGYGKPTSQRALEMIENQEYAYASVEILPKYKSNLIQKLSWDELDEELMKEDLVIFEEITEEIMDEVIIKSEELEALKAKSVQLEQALVEIESLKTKVIELEKPVVEVDEMPETARIMLEEQRTEIERLKRSAVATQVELEISKAESYRDSTGRGHSPVLLEAARKAMLGQAITEGETVIKLEGTTVSDVADYYRKVFVNLLKTLPGQVQFETRTEPDEEREVELERVEGFSKDTLKSFWADVVLGG